MQNRGSSTPPAAAGVTLSDQPIVVSELVARSPQALLEVDANGLVLGASARAAALLNRGQSPLEGLTLASFLAAEDASALAARLRAAVLGEPVEEMTCGVREPPGNAFLLGVTILSLPGVQPPRALVVLRDLTAERHARDEATRKEAEEHRDAAAEHRRAEGDLRQQALENRKLTDLGKLVSGIAHELRTPLTFVGNVMELERQRLSALAAKRPDLSEALTELRDLNGSAVMGLDRIARLVRDLRPLTKNRPHRSTRMDLADLVTDAVRIFRGSRRDDTRVELDLEATHLLDLDREDMVNAVLNLLNNAADAMQGKGRIVVQTRNREIPPEIRVLDQGPGIDPQACERLFEPFYTTKADGTGLGLFIARRTVEAHGGTLTCASGPQGGAVFTIRLPMPPEP